MGGICSFSPFDVDLGVFSIEAFWPERSEGVDPVVFSLKSYSVTASDLWGHSNEC